MPAAPGASATPARAGCSRSWCLGSSTGRRSSPAARRPPMSSAVEAKPAAQPAATGRAPAGISYLATALPERVVPNAEIAARLGVDDEWISSRTGVLERRHAPPDATLADLAADAARQALAGANVDPLDVDLILVATSTADDRVPTAAPLVAERIGAT